MGAVGLNLTWYHRQFLTHLCQCNAPHVIIGGQAKAFHFGTNTLDLDILMPIDNSRNSPVHTALVKWSERFPHHTRPMICEPFTIMDLDQVQFPNADVSVQTDAKIILEITEETKIDILFSIDKLDFESAYKRGVTIYQLSLKSKVLCQQDAINTQRIPK